MAGEAAERGAKLVVFPENMAFAGKGYYSQAEDLSGRVVQTFQALAKEHGIWIVTGSFPLADESGNPKNTLALADPTGRLVCTYSKLHMFDVNVENGPSFCESARNTAGDEIVLADTELGRLGFSICYDLRFGEMYRLMALEGAQVLLVPSNFTMATGKDHWETLLRARAIENGVYVIAPNQIGTKNGIAAYGKSMVIDPWGDVIARCGDRPGVTLAEIDLDYLESVRRQIPSLDNRREDIYQVRSGCVRIYK